MDHNNPKSTGLRQRERSTEANIQEDEAVTEMLLVVLKMAVEGLTRKDGGEDAVGEEDVGEEDDDGALATFIGVVTQFLGTIT